ncbi:MAG: helix-turn-helix domain-containing protein [Anaerolineae bacterium]|nr:helix-turn-helix domain-containing protein [Anaerolineae bacterium]
MDEQERVTVEDVRKLALPLGTRVIAGNGMLSRAVSWATVIYPENDTLPKSIQQDEMILVATPETGKRRLTDLEIVRWACDLTAAAIVVSDTPPPNVIAEANAFEMPLMLLPAGSRARMVEKAVVSLLVDRKGQIERRGIQIYRQLTQISSRNEGMPELINAIARLTNKAIVIQDKRLQFIGSVLQPQFAGLWEEVETFLRKLDNLPVELQDRHRVSEIENPALLQSLPTPGLARLVAPIVTKDVGRGYLSIIGHDTELDDIDQLVAEHGAAACALEMAKAKMVSDTEKRLRGTFLDRVLIGDISQQEALKQGERFDHNMARPHVAIVLAWRGERALSLRRIETTVNTLVSSGKYPALVWQRERENEVVVFHAIDNEVKDPHQHSMRFAKSITEELLRQNPGAHLAVGIGQKAEDIAGWRVSYSEAHQALELAARLHSDTPLFIGDLGVYQLILSLSDKDKLLSFCDAMLGPLLDYDHKQNADLIKTLEAFFQKHGNLSQTADALIVHRNTLLYRMSRINEIAEVDFDRPEIRLGLHLALTIRRLLGF